MGKAKRDKAKGHKDRTCSASKLRKDSAGMRADMIPISFNPRKVLATLPPGRIDGRLKQGCTNTHRAKHEGPFQTFGTGDTRAPV